MNLLILTALYPPAAGGAATYYADLTAALCERDQIKHIVVLTEQQPGLQVREENDRVSVLRVLPQRISRVETNLLAHAVTYTLSDVFLLTRLPAIVRRYDIDIIQFHSRYRSPFTHRALRRTECAVIADLRDQMLDPHQVAFCDAILCCAENLVRAAASRGIPAEKLFYVPNPLPRFAAPAPERVRAILARYNLPAKFLLCVGDITPGKGVYELLDGFEIYVGRRSNVLPLILVGVNREGPRFQRRLSEVAGARFLGALPRDEVLAMMESSQAVLLASKSEGLPTVILEALALGCRVMCPPNVDEFERFCPEWTLKQVSAPAIAEFLLQLETRTELPTFPLENYVLPKVAEKLLEVYTHVLENRY